VVALAAERGLAAIAITDHDTVEGVAEAAEAGAPLGVEVVPGVEISSLFGRHEPHILGLFVDVSNPQLLAMLERLREDRLRRARLIVGKLQALGLDVTVDQVLQRSGPGSVGRMHIAQVISEGGYSSTVQDAFARYIGRRGTAFVDRNAPPTRSAIDAVVAAGGVPVLAHPGHLRLDSEIPSWASWGLKGLEALHTDHSPEQAKRYKEMARKLGIIATGGSDCHGYAKSEPILGSVSVPYSVVEELRRASGKA